MQFPLLVRTASLHLLRGVFLCAATAASLAAQALPATSSVEVLDSVLAKRVASLEAASPSFAQAMVRIRSGQIQVLIGTPAQLRPRFANLKIDPVMGLGMTQVLVSKKEPTKILSILVMVERERMEHLYETHHWAKSSLHHDLEMILAHELFAHVDAAVQSGSTLQMCDDTPPPDAPLNSCSVERENIVRSEMGLVTRKDYYTPSIGFEDALFLLLYEQYREVGLSDEQARRQMILAIHASYRDQARFKALKEAASSTTP